MGDLTGRGTPMPGATGTMVTDEQGRQVFVTADGQRMVMDAAPRLVAAGTMPSAMMEADGERIFVFDAPPADAVPVAAPAGPIVPVASTQTVPPPVTVASAGGGLAPGATGRMELDADGREVFVTADGQRIPLDGGAPRVVDPAAQPRFTLQDEGGAPVFVFDAPAPAAAAAIPAAAPQAPSSVAEGGAGNGVPSAVGGIAPAAGTVLVTPSGERIVMGDANGPQVVISGRRQRAHDGSHIELRSEEIQEIIGAIPHWLVRWGITAIAGTLLVLLAISWFVKYPVSADGRATVTTAVAPVRLVARAGGEVQRLMVAEGDRVERGAPLGVLRNPADWRQVLELSGRLARFEPLLGAGTPELGGRWQPDLALGDVQPAYAAFLQSLSDHLANRSGGWDAEKADALRQQVATHEQLRATLQGQQALLAQEVELARRKRGRDRELLERQLLSVDEADASEAALLRAQQAQENGRAALASNEVQLSAYRAQMVDQRQTTSEDGRTRLVVLRGTYNGLREAIRKWEQDYLLRAPLAGRVSFIRPLAEGQFVAPSEPVLAVVPESGAVAARVELSHVGAGKVRRGQRVRIRFDSYPATEYGAVEGRVERLSLLAFVDQEKEDAVYLAEVSLPRGLVTSYGRTLEFRQEMRGQAQVITEDRRLLERIFDQFRQIAATARG